MQSFLCPNGTVFNQEIFVCSWWFTVDCAKSDRFYHLNEIVTSTTSTTETPLAPKPSWHRRKVTGFRDLHHIPEFSAHHGYQDVPAYYSSSYEARDSHNYRARTSNRHKSHRHRHLSTAPHYDQNHRHDHHNHLRRLDNLEREFNHFSSPDRFF